MIELLNDIYDELVDVLADLDEFATDDDLRKLFHEIDTKWRNRVQQGKGSRAERVEANLKWLYNQNPNNPHNNGVLLLLDKLIENRIANYQHYSKNDNLINNYEINDPHFSTMVILHKTVKNIFLQYQREKQEKLARLEQEQDEKQRNQKEKDYQIQLIYSSLKQIDHKNIIIFCYDYYPQVYAELKPNTSKQNLIDKLLDQAKHNEEHRLHLMRALGLFSKTSTTETPEEPTPLYACLGCIFILTISIIIFYIIYTNLPTSTIGLNIFQSIPSNSFNTFEECRRNCPNEELPQLTLKINEDLHEMNFNFANLKQSVLHQVNLSHASLQWANLACADLSGTNLTGANLYQANLQGANLTNATLINATLREAKYDDNTQWPTYFDPIIAGAKKQPIDNTCNSSLKSPTSPQ